eukprot:Phypoly_transcript_20397.p1 GENE.Phypoly_transcript_20397~~Phypoly_transcript_20397.p1  ORF type:complete len:224 (+),score=24.27 Phypoly_transcript_20397:42-674(+)
MELRVFFNTLDSKFDLWSFLGLVKSGIGNHKEVRADTYFHLNDKRYGLKLRNKSTLELKVLLHSEGNAERWAKTIHTSIPVHGSPAVKWKDVLAPHLGPSTDAKQVLQLLSNFHQDKLVTISKERTQEFVDFRSLNLPPPANKGGCIAEQVDLTFIDGEGRNVCYRSICLEGEAGVIQSAMNVICENIKGKYYVCGYPEFLCHVHNNNNK